MRLQDSKDKDRYKGYYSEESKQTRSTVDDKEADGDVGYPVEDFKYC